jgi:hypothetical protein
MRLIFTILLCLNYSIGEAQSTCATANTLIFDGVCRDYAASGATGAAITCNVNGNQSNVTWFKFTSSTYCPRIEIKTTPAIAFEIVVYDACNGNQYLYPHSLCSSDGDAIWSPDSYNQLQPNKTYYLRIRTHGNFSGGSFNICANWNTTINDNCPTAMLLDGNYVKDDNGCNTPGPGITAQSICAWTLENTAWYSYTIAQNGNSIININNIDCDNYSSASDGFQIGFFTGTCGALQQMPPCTTGAANGSGFVQFTSPYFTAGTQVFVAIDGTSGANCTYEIMATNAEPLSLNQQGPRGPRQRPSIYKIQGTTITINERARFELYDNIGRLIDRQQTTFSRNYSPGFYHMVINGKVKSIWLH